MNIRVILFLVGIVGFAPTQPPLHGQHSAAPGGLKREHKLPDRYPYVVKDVLKYCQPKKGFWIDLGAGKGQVAIPLIEATGNPVVMLDPNVESMTRGLEIAGEKGLSDRLVAVVGVAEKMPFPDNSVDLVVSRGAIFFWFIRLKRMLTVDMLVSSFSNGFRQENPACPSSLLYHVGVRGYRYLRTRWVMKIERQMKTCRCVVCGGERWRQGWVVRRFRTLPIGRRQVFLEARTGLPGLRGGNPKVPTASRLSVMCWSSR